jgi:hypothetical protein
VEVVRGRAYSDEAKKQGECLRKFLLDAGVGCVGRRQNCKAEATRDYGGGRSEWSGD